MDISAELFFNEWVKTYDKHQSDLISCWSNWKEYTKEIKKVCDEISINLDLKIWHEYYGTDTIFYKKDTEEVIGKSTFIINPAIVLEHENRANNFLSEVAHNLILKSNLYVTVSYFNSTLNENYLDKIIRLINKSSNPNELKEKRNFLLILGDSYSYCSDKYWKGLLFNGDDWIEITNNS